MPTVIDALVVELGLDPAKFNVGVKATEAGLKQVSTATVGTGKDMELVAKHVTESFSRVRNEILGLFGLLTAGRGFKALIADVASGDAATGRFAKTLGLSTQQLGAWESAVQRFGGTAEGIKGSMSALNGEIENWKLTGQGGDQFLPWLQRLGVGLKDAQGQWKSIDQIYKDIAASPIWQGMSAPDKASIGSKLGMDQGTINLLSQTLAGVNQQLDAAKRRGVSTCVRPITLTSFKLSNGN